MNSFYKAILALLVGVLNILGVTAQPFCRVRTFNVQDGLPSNSISKIIQDENGLLWASTWNGLSYYDGYQFTSFRGNDRYGTLTSNRILDIESGPGGLIWALTYDRNPYLFNSHSGHFIPLGGKIEEKLGKPFEGGALVAGDRHVWIIGAPKNPTVRVPNKVDIPRDSIMVVDSSQLKNNATRVRDIQITSDGGEWILTDGGVQLYGTQLAEAGHFVAPVQLGGVIFFATEDGKFYTYRTGDTRLSPVVVPAGLDLREVSDLKGLGDTRLVAATGRGIAVYDLRSKTWSLIESATPIRDINIDSRNRIWGSGENGEVYLTDPFGSNMTRVPYSGATHSATHSVPPIWIEDRFGTVWLAPRNGMFGYYDEANHTLEAKAILAPHSRYAGVPTIEKFFIDDHHNLWVSTTHDLTLVNFMNHTVKTVPLGFNDELRSLLPRRDGTLWGGSTTGVLARFTSEGVVDGYIVRNGNRIAISNTPQKFSLRIYSLFEDRNGVVWVGTKGEGLFAIHPDGNVSHYRHDPSDINTIPCDTVYDVVQDNRGNIWVGTFGGGLCLMRGDRSGHMQFLHAGNYFSTYPKEKFLRVRRMTITPEGVMAVSTTDGLLTFSNRFSNPAALTFNTSCHVPGDTASLLTSNVMQTLITASGDVYVATMGGAIQRLVGKDLLQSPLRFTGVSSPSHPLYFLQSNLGAGNVMSMIEDAGRNLYIVRETSLEIYSPANGSVNVFGPNDLGESVEFTEAAPAYSPQSGRIWFGILGGMVFLNPDEITTSDRNLNIIFTGVQYQGDTEKQQILNPGCIEVQGAKRNLAISFAALDYTGNNYIQYAYRMGDDTDWTYIGAAHSVQFNHLSPGIHRLVVKSTNSSGVWLENERHIDILVRADFWESIWAKMLYAVMVIIVGGTLIYFFLQHRKNTLTNELHRKEKEFFINASHRLRTPLTLIGSPVTEVLDNEPLSDTARYHLERVRRNASEMLGMVNEMLQGSTNGADYITDESIPSISSENGIVLPPEEDGSTPAGEVAPPFQHTPDNATPAKEESKGKDNRVKILVVEDNDDLRQFLCDILSGRYNVIEAANGLEGLRKAEAEQPDFIVTDVTMPEMDGLTMVHNIKQDKSLSHIPIIVLSAKASLKDRVQGLKEGIDDYITKPFSATYLRQRIANIIAQRKLLQQSIFEQIGHEMKAGIPGAVASAEQGAETKAEAARPAAGATAGTQPNESTSAYAPTPAGADAPANAEAPAQAEERPEWRLDSPQITDADQEMMEKLLKFMETRIGDEDLKIEELAEAVNMGRTVFYGKIKALVGMPPSDFLRKLRMQRAEELIARSKMNFSQIAFNVGFSDPKYFTKCFKKETGMTPSEYRQQAALQNKAPEGEE